MENGLKILGIDLTEDQYLKVLEVAKSDIRLKSEASHAFDEKRLNTPFKQVLRENTSISITNTHTASSQNTQQATQRPNIAVCDIYSSKSYNIIRQI